MTAPKLNPIRYAWLLPAGALLASAGGCASTQQPQTTQADTTITSTPRAVTAPDGAPVTISGTVVATGISSFTLDYGDGHLLVEMDDFDVFPEARHLMVDDQVVVHGRVDADFYEKRTIEAGSVYVHDLGTYFFANSRDEESLPHTSVLVDGRPTIELTGTVRHVAGDEFVLETPAGEVDVNTKHMPYDPLDGEGYQRIEPGDRVRVTGRLGHELFSDLDLMAETLVSLSS